MSMQRCFVALGSRCQKVNMEQPSRRAKKWQPKWKRNQSNWHNCILNIHEGPAHSYFVHIITHNVMGYCTRVRITFKVVMISRLPYHYLVLIAAQLKLSRCDAVHHGHYKSSSMINFCIQDQVVNFVDPLTADAGRPSSNWLQSGHNQHWVWAQPKLSLGTTNIESGLKQPLLSLARQGTSPQYQNRYLDLVVWYC